MPDTLNNLQNGIYVSTSSRKNETILTDSHVHSYNEIYFLLTGNAKYFIDNEIINIQRGNLVFVQSGLIHKTTYECGNYTERIIIYFNDNFVDFDLYDEICDLGNQKLIKISPHSQFEIEELIKQIKKEYDANDKYNNKMCKFMLSQLLITVSRQKNHILKKSLTENEMIIQNAAKYIADNYADDLTLSGLSEKFAMSESHFSKTFKFHTGFGVSEYITTVRITNAEKLLKSSSLSITDVASKCGFNDSNYFASVFKKKKGITPLKYSVLYKQSK